MNFKKCLSLLLVLCFVLSCFSVTAFAAGSSALRFKSDGTFTILQITDPQDDAHPAKELAGFIKKAIETAKPDLIVFTGDLVEDSRAGDRMTDDDPLHEGVTVKGDYNATLENAKTCCAAIFAPVEEAGIPFAVTLGNNDYKSGVTDADWLAIFAQYPHCITTDQSNDADGKIDSFVTVNDSKTGLVPKFGLWLLDNGKGFSADQLNWFSSKTVLPVPSIVFEHIPVDDIGNLFKKCTPFDSGAIVKNGKVFCLDPTLASGHCECAYVPGTTTDVFTAWKNKNVVGAFFGHIHTDGYTGVWNGITLGVTYGCEFAKAGPYGIRTITLNQSNPQSFETQLYTYSDSNFTMQTENPLPSPGSGADAAFASVLHLLEFLKNAIAYALKF